MTAALCALAFLLGRWVGCGGLDRALDNLFPLEPPPDSPVDAERARRARHWEDR